MLHDIDTCFRVLAEVRVRHLAPKETFVRPATKLVLLLILAPILLVPLLMPKLASKNLNPMRPDVAAVPGANRLPIETMSVLKPQILAGYGRLPLSFEANQGQTDPHVKFISRGSGYSLFLTPTEAVLALRSSSRDSKVKGQEAGAEGAGLLSRPGAANKFLKKRSAADLQDKSALQETVLCTKLAGANPAPKISGVDELPGKSNYFVGNDPRKWRTNVPTYAQVKYQRVYPGVDLVYHGTQGQLEYDFVVAPGADPGVIRLSFEGADRLELDAQGDLVLHTPAGEVREHKPVVYQEMGGVRQTIAGGYVLRSKAEAGFAVAQYDTSQPLVIDPALVYSTYLLGASGFDEGLGIAVDSTGNAYVTGYTDSSNFPVLPNPGAFQPAFGGGSYDAFVTKLNPAGTALLYSTYLGGNSFDQGLGIAVDSTGNAYVTGLTNSSDFPVFPNPGAFQSSLRGRFTTNAFVTKLNPAGTALLYSTYLGGTGGGQGDSGLGIAVDMAGNAYVTGYTDSSDFPTTLGAFQTTFGGGLCYYGYYTCFDAFVTKLNPAGGDLGYSTYLGGKGDDFGDGVAVDTAGNAYVTGETCSANFPTTTGAFQTTSGGGLCDAFVTKLNPAGTAPLAYSTYLGGNSFDQGRGIAVDPGCGPAPAAPCNAYVTGLTNSINFPVFPNPGAFQTMPQGRGDAFVTKLNPLGTDLGYSTYLGGSGFDEGVGIAVDSVGNAYVTGDTRSEDFPTPSDAFQPSSAGSTDAFVTKLNATGTALGYSTYLGGDSFDAGRGIAVDSVGNAYVTGITNSTNFPTTPGAFQRVFRGDPADAFVSRIVGGAPPVDFLLSATPSSQTVSAGSSPTYTVNISRTGGFTGAVTFTAAGLPAGAMASFSPNPVPGNSSTLTVTTTTATTGSFTITITGVSGNLTHATSVTLLLTTSDLGLSAAPSSRTVSAGASTNYTVNITRTGGFTGAVTFSATGLPAGATASFSPNPASGNSSAMTVTTATTTPTGSFTVTITGDSGSLTRNTSVTLVVIGAGDFSISATPSRTVSAGASTTYTVNISRPGGFAGAVTFSATGLPAGATASFNPPASGNSSGMTVTTATTTPTGSFTVTITGVSGSFTHTTSATLVVTVAPGFSLSATPSSQTVSAGASTIYTVNISRTGGFTGAVNFSATGLPAGATASFSPNPASGDSLTVTATTTARGLLVPWPKLRLPPATFSVRGWPLWAIGLLVLVLLAHRTKTRRQAALWIFAATVFVVLLVVACRGRGSSPRGTPAGTSTLLITGTFGNLTHTTTVTLTVN